MAKAKWLFKNDKFTTVIELTSCENGWVVTETQWFYKEPLILYQTVKEEYAKAFRCYKMAIRGQLRFQEYLRNKEVK